MLFLKEGKKPLLIFFLFSELQIAAGLGAKMDLNTSIRASDRVWQKMGNSAAFSREIMRQERSIMRQIMRFF